MSQEQLKITFSPRMVVLSNQLGMAYIRNRKVQVRNGFWDSNAGSFVMCDVFLDMQPCWDCIHRQ